MLALAFVLVAVGHIIGAIASGRLVPRLGMNRMIQVGALLACASGIEAAGRKH